MSDLTFIDKRALEELFEMGGGYVLDFSNRTFQEFVAESIALDIYDDKFAFMGSSKANRLRALWKIASNEVVAKLLTDLCKYARYTGDKQLDESLLAQCQAVAARLQPESSMPSSEPLIFVSYARPDSEAASAVVEVLADAGLRTWFDRKDLKGGQEWEYEIRKQIATAALVIVCLSSKAVDKKGFFHKELRYAVDEALKLPKGKVYIVPVRFDKCPIPDDLQKWHTLDLFKKGASQCLLNSIGDALECGARARFEAHEVFATAMQKYAVD